jgi:cell division protein FtsQ
MWFRKHNRRQATKSPTRDAEASVAITPANRKRLLFAVGAVGLALATTWAVLALLDQPVRRVEVSGQFLRVSPLQIEQAVLAYSKAKAGSERGFVSLRLEELKTLLEKIDWVDQARIERRWPDGVRVTISEQIPGARWGEHGLLNSRGELFLKDARYMPAELPQLNGPEGTEAQVARLYLDTYPRLAAVGLRLARVTLDPRGAWELIVTSTQGTATNNGGVAIRLGRQEVSQRLDRFLTAASPLIATRAGEMAYVDMRYSNGFAVGWTNAVARGPGPTNKSVVSKTMKQEVTPDV